MTRSPNYVVIHDEKKRYMPFFVVHFFKFYVFGHAVKITTFRKLTVTPFRDTNPMFCLSKTKAGYEPKHDYEFQLCGNTSEKNKSHRLFFLECFFNFYVF